MKKKKHKKLNSKNTTGQSRHIPEDVSEKLKHRHFFECAWCGIKLTERHHIKEWSLGGQHSEENLILLCPNCHTLTHKGQITSEQLRDRKSTHLKADRVAGNFQTSLEVLKLKMGSNFFIGVKHLVAYKYQSILSWVKENDNILLNANFFDANGDMVFWMRRNIFWAPSAFKVTTSLDWLAVLNGEENILEFSKEQDYLKVRCRVYLGRDLFEISSTDIFNARVGRSTVEVSDSTFTGSHIGFWHAPKTLTEKGFLERNNEKTDLTGDAISFGGGVIEINPNLVRKIGEIRFDPN